MPRFTESTHSLHIIYAFFTALSSDQNTDIAERGRNTSNSTCMYTQMQEIFLQVKISGRASQSCGNSQIGRGGTPHWRTDGAEGKIYIVRKRTSGRQASAHLPGRLMRSRMYAWESHPYSWQLCRFYFLFFWGAKLSCHVLCPYFLCPREKMPLLTRGSS